MLIGQYVPETATNEHLMWIVNEAIAGELAFQNGAGDGQRSVTYAPTKAVLIGPDESAGPWDGMRITVQYNTQRIVTEVCIG